ncbi:hypothetical protein Pyn_21765 [Prunus yedoensis var. nudiflora]|uniref:Uncharacterized protein n=1 Tax=Prunus yedoensis var. nudiflora TaxID=2094558 RepID=A0A314ZAI3_PRUYE|nr:hypothetical protein Pyn_21765 [Prunus yedoensis var. nudiflora]
MRGEPSIFVWGGALQIQPPSWSLSHRFSSQMLSSCVLIPAALHPSSHRTGYLKGFLGFEHEEKGDFATSPKHFRTTTKWYNYIYSWTLK